MTIADIIRNSKGRTHGWEVENEGDGLVALVHHGTALLVWEPANLTNGYLWINIGRGSVSDQNGLNTAFKVLGLPYRMDRDQRGGGPRITTLA
jgi:hypothetical protein